MDSQLLQGPSRTSSVGYRVQLQDTIALLILVTGSLWTLHLDLEIPGMPAVLNPSLPNSLTHTADEFPLREILYLILLRRLLETALGSHSSLTGAIWSAMNDREALQQPPSIFTIRYCLYVSHTIICYVSHALSVLLPRRHLFSQLFSLALSEVTLSHSRLQHCLTAFFA